MIDTSCVEAELIGTAVVISSGSVAEVNVDCCKVVGALVKASGVTVEISADVGSRIVLDVDSDTIVGSKGKVDDTVVDGE